MSSSNTLFFLVGEVLEPAERLVERVLTEIVAQRPQLFAERVAAGVLAHHQVRAALPDILGPHDLVGLGVLQHAVLMDAGLVGEGVLADDGFVELHRKAGDRRDVAAGAGDVLGADLGAVGQPVTAHLQRHHHLFQRRVAGPLADAVDRDLDLTRAGLDAGQAVGDGEAQVVVAVGGEDHRVRPRHIVDQVAIDGGVFIGVGVADGVGDVDRLRSGADRRLDAATQHVPLGAGGVLGRPFDVAAQIARAGYRLVDRLDHVFRRHAQDVVAVLRAGRDEGVDAAALGGLERLGAALDVGDTGAGQAADDALGDDLGDLRTASKSPLEAIGKPASITSTRMSSRILASSSFSSMDIEAPGDCSPSRMVVSNSTTWVGRIVGNVGHLHNLVFKGLKRSGRSVP